MKSTLLRAALPLLLAGAALQAQVRYQDDVFTDSEITVTDDVVYGTNFSAYVPASLGGPQVIPLFSDVYMPDPSIDMEMNRPVVIYLHTGSFLPRGLASPMGFQKDSAAVEICTRLAKKGYVAISASYRLGWQADNTTNLDLRRGSNLMAVYNAVQDAKAAVRFVRASKQVQLSQLPAIDPFHVDPNNVMLIGQGSGGYITLAYGALSDLNEIVGPSKFQYQNSTGIFGGTVNPGDPYVDTSAVGDWNGFGGKATIIGTNPNTGLPAIDLTAPGRNIENYPGVPDAVSLVMNMGGALGDSAWSDAGETPVVSVHCRYDFFAPYYRGMVRVPVSGQFWDVVDVAGSHTAVKSANITGNNDIFVNAAYNDVYTQKALNNRFNIGQVEGVYTMNIPPADPALPFRVNSNPWDFWDPSDPLSANETNPNNKAVSLAYIDTVMGYFIPRMVTVLQANGIPVGLDEVSANDLDLDIYPNPADDYVKVRSRSGRILEVRLMDITGKTVRRVDENSLETRLQLDDLRAGVYLISVRTEEGNSFRKLTIH
jgi:hypothetical protein